MLLAAPIVNTVSPGNLGVGVGISAHVSAGFDQAIDPTTLDASTLLLSGPSGSLARRISYNSASKTVTLDAASPLAYSTVYTATVKGGAAGVKNTLGEPLANDLTWTFTTVASPTTGPGGPVLVLTSPSNPFSTYYPEILRAEGLNAFTAADLSTVNSTTLAAHDLVILGQMPLTTTQVTMFSDYVGNGGHLIAMRPDKQLAGLLGLSDTGFTLANAYLLVNTASSPGAGITNQTMQFHGSADNYAINGATSIATLYSTATAATSYPAVTIRSVGSNGGQAAAFTYDLARSIVYTRQGNPAWAGQERDGLAPVRSDDLFYGNASFDPQADWVDLNKVQIPQADEQQRLLANLMNQLQQDRKALPRFWYFPRGEKAVVLMSGDDHANGGTAGRFDQYIAASPEDANVADWQAVRSTSYIYSNTPVTDLQAAQYAAQGFEIGLHPTSDRANFTSYADLDAYYTTQMDQFLDAYPSLPTPTTNRFHAIVWSDYDSQPKVELSHRIRIDDNYYYFPATWIQDRPGLFTGSGIPMRFASVAGDLIDVYQSTTQMTDESGQSYPYTIDVLLDNALGPSGYYGVFAANMHTDLVNSPGSDAILASAQARGVPIITSEQLLNWLDGRNGSSFDDIVWSAGANTLSFNVTAAVGANGLTTMIPTSWGTRHITSITENGTPVPYTAQVIKGVEYAFFAVGTATYSATYTTDAIAPVIFAVNASPAATGRGATVTWTTDEPANSRIDYGTSPTALTSSVSDSVRSASHSIALTGLNPNTTYYYRVTSIDSAGNSGAWPSPTGSASFLTPASIYTIWSDNAVPAIIADPDTRAVELGVRFRADVAGYIRGIRFYKSATNTGAHTGTLWSDTGTLLATTTFANETSSGWQQVFFSNPVAINANTSYVASYHTNVGHFSATSRYFEATGVDSPPLHALRNGADGPNGVYRYGSSAFPTNSYFSANYWVDVLFSLASGPAPDTTPPALTSRSPASGDVNVPTTAAVAATFSEPVQASSFSFVLRDPANNAAPASVIYNSSTHTVTLTPASRLAGLTTYTATLTGVQDVAGNTMAPVSWSFTTVAVTLPAVISQSPAPNATNVPIDTTVTATFNKPVQGGSIVFTLMTSSGANIPDALSYDALTRTANFTPSSLLTEGATYIATVTNAQDADGNNMAGPVSWSFTMARIIPAVTTQSPPPGATGVPTTAAPTASFNEPVLPASIVFTLMNAGGADIPGSVSYNAANFTATFTPASPLALLTTYTATVSSATDANGDTMAGPVSWSFATIGSWQQTTAADFGAGTSTNTAITNTFGGEIQLASSGIIDEFAGASLSSSWTTVTWPSGTGAAAVNLAGGVLSIGRTRVLSTQTASNTPVEGRINVAAAQWQQFGLATNLNTAAGNYWAVFTTKGTTNTLYARVNDSGTIKDMNIGARPVGFHLYRVEPIATGFRFYVDGVLKTTISRTFPPGTQLKAALSALNGSPQPALQADWVRMGGYSASGAYLSTVFDAGRTATWGAAIWTMGLPAGTSILVETSSGNTPTPDDTWSAWTAVDNGGAVASPAARYLRYRLTLTTIDPATTPTVLDIVFTMS